MESDLTTQRFMAKTAADPATGCWLWTGYVQPNGYGSWKIGSRTDGSRRTVLVHRWSHEHFKSPIPKGMTIDHLCSVPRCVNPDHLEVVTMRVNLMRGATVTARNASQTQCPQGHPYEGENLMVRANGDRHCRACHCATQRARYERIKADPERYERLKAKRRAYQREYMQKRRAG